MNINEPKSPIQPQQSGPSQIQPPSSQSTKKGELPSHIKPGKPGGPATEAQASEPARRSTKKVKNPRKSPPKEASLSQDIKHGEVHAGPVAPGGPGWTQVSASLSKDVKQVSKDEIRSAGKDERVAAASKALKIIYLRKKIRRLFKVIKELEPTGRKMWHMPALDEAIRIKYALTKEFTFITNKAHSFEDWEVQNEGDLSDIEKTPEITALIDKIKEASWALNKTPLEFRLPFEVDTLQDEYDDYLAQFKRVTGRAYSRVREKELKEEIQCFEDITEFLNKKDMRYLNKLKAKLASI